MEPTIKEIAEWLRDCSDCFDMISREIKEDPFRGYSKRCEEISSQVEAMGEMGCWTCEYWAGMKNFMYNSGPCEKEIPYQGPDFCCIHWKRKEG
jgi:hypothetical protein